jgi:IS5 family transposase
MGRPSIPMETYLRLMFFKHRYRLGYETPCTEVFYSIWWRRFCRIDIGGRLPHPTTLMKLTTRCGEATIAALNEELLATRMSRLVRRIKPVGAASRTAFRDRSRSAGRRVRSIAARLRLRGAQARDEAQAVLRNARRALSRTTGHTKGRLRRAVNELADLIRRTATVISQARTRRYRRRTGSSLSCPGASVA